MKAAIVGGSGGMGILVGTLLKKHGISVTPIGRQTKDVKAIIKASDIIIFSVSFDVLRDFVDNLSKVELKGKLLLDLSSQVLENSALLASFPGVYAFVHFLFGPDIQVFKHQHVIVSKGIKDKRFFDIQAILNNEGMHSVATTPERHDYMMALVQALSQFSSIALAKTLSESDTHKKELEDFSSVTFSLNAAAISRIVLQKPELWANIQFHNKFFKKILDLHIKNIEALAACVDSKDHDKFDKIFNNLSTFWKDKHQAIFTEKENVTKVSPKTLGILGPKGSYSEQASAKLLAGTKPAFFDSISDVVNALESEMISQAVLPLENSIQGTVFETLDGIYHNGLKIVDECVLPIQHVIAGLDKKIPAKDIEHIYSHFQALGQCAGYLKTHYPQAKVILSPSTSAAFKKIKDEGLVDALAVGSKFAAETYDLSVISENIQDQENNETCFVLATRKPATSLTLPYVLIAIDPQKDKPGLLHDILGIFKKNDINLLKLESRPKRSKLGTYLFYIKAELRQDDKRLAGMLKEIGKYGAVTLLTN